MIIEKIFYGIKCDRCSDLYENGDYSYTADESSILEEAFDDEWREKKDKHYCPNCYTINDSDEVIPKPDYPAKVTSIFRYIKSVLYRTFKKVEKDGILTISIYDYSHPRVNIDENVIQEIEGFLGDILEGTMTKEKDVYTIKVKLWN